MKKFLKEELVAPRISVGYLIAVLVAVVSMGYLGWWGLLLSVPAAALLAFLEERLK